MCKGDIEIISLVVSMLMLGVVFWYTYVNLGLLKAARKQTDELIHQRRLSLMPCLFAEMKYDSPGRDILRLSNVGNGVALNITIDPINIHSQGDYIYEFRPIATLIQKESITVDFDEIVVGLKTDAEQKSLMFLTSESAIRKIEARATFHDLEGVRYQQILYLGQGGYKPDYPHIEIKQP